MSTSSIQSRAEHVSTISDGDHHLCRWLFHTRYGNPENIDPARSRASIVVNPDGTTSIASTPGEVS